MPSFVDAIPILESDHKHRSKSGFRNGTGRGVAPSSPSAKGRLPEVSIFSNTTAQRAPFGGIFKPPPNSPFSHIRIVPKISPATLIERPQPPQVTFQSPSYTQEAEQKMAAQYPVLNSTSAASLANMTSGTTFAAKARAAELNAVRSRKVAKDMEIDNGLLSTIPVHTGALKFTKTRNRGRAWKALKLDDLPESETDQDIRGVQSSRPSTPQYPADNDYRSVERGFAYRDFANTQGLYPKSLPQMHSYQANRLSPSPQSLVQMAADYDNDEWIPDLALSHGLEQETLSIQVSHPLNSQQFSRSSSEPSYKSAAEQSLITSDQRNTLQSFPQGQAANVGRLVSEHKPSQASSDTPLEPKPTERGVRPSLESSMRSLGVKTDEDNEDPFTELSQVKLDSLYDDNVHEQKVNHDFNTTVHGQPTTVKGMMNPGFRFPSSQQPQHTLYPQPYTNKLSHGQTEFLNGGTKNRHISNFDSHQRDPMPYSSFTTNSKKDLLLQNLHEVVESSKAQGSLSTSTRTVLYDPITRESSNQAQHSVEAADQPTQGQAGQYDISNRLASEELSKFKKEVLQDSEDMMWKDRPVVIYNMATSAHVDTDPTQTSGGLASQVLPPGLYPGNSYIWSLVLKPKVAGRSLQEAEEWFHTDARGFDNLKVYLENAADIGHSARNAKARRDMRKVSERHSSQADTWSDASASTTIPEHPSTTEVATHLAGPVFGNLQSYVSDTTKQEAGYFGRFARVPEWCIDKGQGGQTSFFGDWGVPPSRVGRDPRYRPTFHEGRYTVFEPMDRRSMRDNMGGRFR